VRVVECAHAPARRHGDRRQARTGGNPFFAHEVARLIAARGPAAAFMVPPGVGEVLQRRLARLSQPCVSLLAAAAIVAETAAEAIEDDLLQHVSGVRQEAAAELLDEAAAGLLLEVGHVGPSRYRFRHTAAEYADDVSTLMAAAGPDIPGMYYAAPARLLLAAGDASQARAVLRALLAGPAEAGPKDAEWLECHWAMADLAISLDDRAAAIRLAADLAPYEVLWAVDGMGGAVFGVVAEQLGRLAAYLGRPEEAARYLATARDQYERTGAPALHARLDALAVPQPQAAASRLADGFGLLRRSGQVWFAEWHGCRSIVPDSKGIRDLAVLLARPGERARKAVTMRIRAAISTIAAQDDTLARHLRNTIRTGRLCSYQPEEAVSWRT
jgi:hypothetical protein